MERVGIVTALADESAVLRENLGQYMGTDSGAYEVHKYLLEGKSVYLINSGVGEIAAALAAQYLALQYKADAILNVGLVGSLNKDLKRGCLALVKEAVHYDFSRSYTDASCMGIHIGRDSAILTPDISIAEKSEHLSLLPKVRIASGDKFVNDSAFKEMLVNKFGCDICDMESAGLFFACERFDLPLIMVKCVSDNADEGADVSFNEVVNAGVGQYVTCVKELLKQL